VRVGVLTSPCDLRRSATRSPNPIDKYHIPLELADYQLVSTYTDRWCQFLIYSNISAIQSDLSFIASNPCIHVVCTC
jgi:hypothetical protein